MTEEAENLLTLSGLLASPDTVLRLPERQDASAAELWERLVAGTYDKPFLIDDGTSRSLCFMFDGSVQTEMRLDDPVALVNDYTRKMMAFLLFCERRPRHIVMIGLGGGSLLKFCRRHLPETRLTVVEIDATVIGLRRHFHVPPDDDWLRVVHADGAQYLANMANSAERADVLLVDAYDRNGLAHSVAARGFLEDASVVLGDSGVFVMNLAAYESDCIVMLDKLRSVFGSPVMSTIVGWGGNTIAFAGAALREVKLLAAVDTRARQIHQELNLEFSRLPLLVNEYLSTIRGDQSTAADA
jgi:spermidine synthase